MNVDYFRNPSEYMVKERYQYLKKMVVFLYFLGKADSQNLGKLKKISRFGF